MSDIIDGQNATLTMGGQVVGGVLRYEPFQGSPPVIRHRPLSAPASIYLPPIPDYGTISITIYRNHADPGQQQMADSQANQLLKPCTLKLEDDTVLSFDAFTERLPLTGGKQAGQTINTSVARLRITGVVTTTMP